MKPAVPPVINSFVIRFVVEEGLEDASVQPVYRGAIRHVQSAEELNFSEWNQAMEFIRRFVPIEDLSDRHT